MTLDTDRSGKGAAGRDMLELLKSEYGIHRIRCSLPIPGSVNIYFVKEPVPTLIDAPPEGTKHLEELDKGLRSAGCTVRDIQRVIITHPHFDHYGLARTIIERSGAELWALGDGAHWIEDHEKELRDEEAHRNALLERAGATVREIEHVTDYYRKANWFARGTRVSRYLKGDETFSLGSFSFTLSHVPGHTPFCVLLREVKNRLVFTGDFLPRDIASFPLVLRADVRRSTYKPARAYLASLKKARAMNLGIGLPGHGQIIPDASAKIEQILGLIEKRRKAVLATLKDGNRTAVEVARQIFPGLSPEDLFRGVTDVMGHLEMLQEDGLIESTGDFELHFRAI